MRKGFHFLIPSINAKNSSPALDLSPEPGTQSTSTFMCIAHVGGQDSTTQAISRACISRKQVRRQRDQDTPVWDVGMLTDILSSRPNTHLSFSFCVCELVEIPSYINEPAANCFSVVAPINKGLNNSGTLRSKPGKRSLNLFLPTHSLSVWAHCACLTSHTCCAVR